MALSSILINAYEDVYQLFTAKKASQLRIRHVCVLPYIVVVNFVGIEFLWISLSFLSMIIYEV